MLRMALIYGCRMNATSKILTFKPKVVEIHIAGTLLITLSTCMHSNYEQACTV